MRPKTLIPALVLFACLVSVSNVHALANRVFVSARSGNDANSCDNILTPCKTFAGAVTQVAAGGEVIVLDSGGYGPVTISKALKIEAPPGIVAFIHPPSGHAIEIVTGAADVVTLRGLVLSVGASNGILVLLVGELHVENCVIDGFGTGIEFVSPGKLYVVDTVVRNSTGPGIDLVPPGVAVAAIERCRLEKNVDGLSVGAFGEAAARASIKDSFVVGQSNVGLRADTGTGGGTSELNIENCLVANNDTGIFSFASTGTAVVRVSNSTVTDNGSFGVNTSLGGQLLTRSNNSIEGNGTDGSFTGTFTAK